MTNQKQIHKKKPTVSNVQLRVKVLVKAFGDLQEEYLEKSRKILLKIVDLRRIHKLDYNYMDLINEDGLEGYTDRIELFVRYNELQPEIVKLQAEGLLNNNEAYMISSLPKTLLKPENQRKIAEGLKSGEITSQDIREQFRGNNVIFGKIRENPLAEYNRILLHTVYDLSAITNNIKENKRVMRKVLDQSNTKKLVENFKKLKNAIQNELRVNLR